MMNKQNSVTQNNFPYYAYSIKERNSFPFNPYFGTMHHHHAIQLVFVVNGYITFKDITKQPCTVRKNEGILINSDTIHEIIPHKGSHYFTIRFPTYFVQFYLGSPTQSLINQLLSQPELSSFIFTPKTLWQKAILDNLKSLYQLECLPHKHFYPYTVLTELSQIFLELMQNIRLSSNNDRETKGVERIQIYLNFIENNYPNKITLYTLATSAHVSESTCLRDFHQYLKQSPYQYLNNYRLEQAARFLKNSDYSISTIAEKVGFNSASYFSAIFNKKTGLMPKEYRKT